MRGRNRITRSALRIACALGAAIAVAGCKHDVYSQYKVPVVCRTTGPAIESVYFIGDAGAPKLPDPGDDEAGGLVDPVLRGLADAVSASVASLGADRTAVVVLGDNVYPSGLALEGEADRERGIRILEAQIRAIGDARGYFILGNHDWDQGSARGILRARAQYDYLAARAPNVSIHPAETCPGPEDILFGDHLHFVFLDVWAAIAQLDDPEVLDHCKPRAGDGRLAEVVDGVLGDADGRRAVLVAHPPMLTSGPHGGYFPWREHVFPLRVFHRDLWIPLPVIGSIFPLARVLGVTDTDMMSPRYQLYIDRLRSLFTPGHPTLVAAGHEHSLQIHIDPTGTFHAVSGAGSVSKVDYVREMKSDLMALAAPGFMRLDTYADSTLRLNVFALEADEPGLVYSTCIP